MGWLHGFDGNAQGISKAVGERKLCFIMVCFTFQPALDTSH
jgi:hypothetical protein